MQVTFDSDGIPSWMTKYENTDELIQFLKTEAVKKPSEAVYVHIKDKDMDFIMNKVPHLDIGTAFMAEIYGFVGSPFLFSLLFGEYDAAERILDAFKKVSVRGLGRLELINLGTYHYYRADYENLDIDKNRIETLLYEPKVRIPENLRNKLFDRLEEEASDLSCFTLKKVFTLDDPGQQKIFLKDYENFPGIFEYNAELFANDFKTLLFLLGVYKHDHSAQKLLKNTDVRLKYINYVSHDTETINRLTKDMESVGKVIDYLKDRPGIRTDLYVFAMRIITELRYRYKQIPAIEELALSEMGIWKQINEIPFDEEQFSKLLSALNRGEEFRIEILYELALRRLGKKMPLTIYKNDYESLYQLLRVNEAPVIGNNFGGGFFQEDQSIRLMILLNMVDKLEYDSLYSKREMAKILIRHKKELKDIFPILIEKCFIPGEYVDYLIRTLSNIKGCDYMLPLLINQKFGGF